MKTLAELRAELAEVRAKMQQYVAIKSMSEEETEELNKLTSKATELSARIVALEQIEAGKADAERVAKEERDAAIAEAVKQERQRQPAADRRPPYHEGVPYQAQFSDTARYDHMDATELSLLIDLQKAFAAKGQAYANGEPIVPTSGAMKAMSLRVAEMKPDTNTGNAKQNEANRQVVEYIKNAFKLGTKSMIEPTVEAVNAAIKAATDPMYTGGSGVGSDWVGTAYSSEIWRKIRAATQVVANIPSDVVPDGYSSKTWPIEGADFTWYKTPEASASDSTLKVPAPTVTASQLVTANKNITIGKMSARGLYSNELDEDSLIRFAPQARDQLEKSGTETLESLILDGDVETSANKNINSIDGTPASTDYYLILDGFRKLALITNTANSRSAGGSLTVDDFLATLKLMGTAGIAGANPQGCAFIVDGNVYYAMALLPELKTKDVYSNATIEGGFVSTIWKVPVVPSWHMNATSSALLANTSGKVATTTPANNTTGTAVAVRWDQWKLAYKRRMTIEVTRFANSDSWEIVGHTRLGLGNRDNEASAVLYNVGV